MHCIPPDETKSIALYSSPQLTLHLGDFIVGDDGYYVFFPKETNHGYYNQFFLSFLLSKLTALNIEWDAIVQSSGD